MIIYVAVIYKLRKKYAFYLRTSKCKCKFKLQIKKTTLKPLPLNRKKKKINLFLSNDTGE